MMDDNQYGKIYDSVAKFGVIEFDGLVFINHSEGKF